MRAQNCIRTRDYHVQGVQIRAATYQNERLKIYDI
jgi:hypothetical protein